MTKIEERDDVVFKFKQKTIVEVYEYEDYNLERPVAKIFEKDEEIEVTIWDVDSNNYGVRFENNTMAFFIGNDVEIISVN